MLEIRGVNKTYQTGGLKTKALDNININFRVNEFVAILGPSGSGKTTLLNIIGGLDHYTSGDIKINEISTKNYHDKEWDSYRNHRIGFVFQSYNLIPHQTVLQNVRLALTLSGISKRKSIRRAKKALEDVGLKDQINKKPSQLSGGQMQRVAIARALVNNPDILLADEPTGALDSETSIQIMNLLKEVSKNKLVIMVTHNPELAEKYATRIVTLKDGKLTSDSNTYNGKIKTNLNDENKRKKTSKTKMSFLTALSLSLNNLLTKKARTILVALAGSIGIIGIALISAVSTGFQNYIDTIEEDTLTSYPLTLMEESTDFTGVLLSLSNNDTASEKKDKLIENQVITSTLGNVSHNDLESFMNYYHLHEKDISNNIRLIEYQYNIDPLIYTIDASGELAKLNPNSFFTSVMGDSTLLSSYSNMTSIFQQTELENITENTEIVAGRYPEKYDEIVVSLSNPGQISDVLTYSLGFHNTREISETLTKIFSGEPANIENEPLELSYEDVLNADLRLIPNTSIFKYNEKYNVYEDMSENKDYMLSLYKHQSEKLKVVGIVTPKSNMSAIRNGILYLPSLTTHIIEEAEKTEIVKKQLNNPKIDIFSDKKFGEKENDFDFQFSDLAAVDNEALKNAFNITIDQNAISSKTKEYLNQVSNDISNGTSSLPEIRKNLINRFKTLAEGLKEILTSKIESGEIDPADLITNPELAKQIITELTNEFVNKQDFSELEKQYQIPSENIKTAYTGLLMDYLAKSIQNITIEDYTHTETAVMAFDNLAVAITNISMQQEILSKIGNLIAYLSNSFARAFNIDESALISAFKLNFSEEELARVVSAMFNKKETTLASNLSALGYQNPKEPTRISFYFNSFDGKTIFINFLDEYNRLMESYNNEDKIIDYTDATGILMSSVKTIVDAVSYVLIAFVSISLVVSSIMIGVITYISVYERTKEIGILRAIGASKHNISSIFNAETFIIGLLSGLFGVIISYILIPPINLVLHHYTGDIPLSASLDIKMAGFLIILSIVLTLIGGIIPARAASKKDPVEALRSE
ncbi:ATP-binding cassette domain-containing protein [Candidatus Saccharibacteria bacterium]|nr:ATP-binding cassette domain-containing protein [Candidatus Saccharibacteria bacterium]